jgi:hypothetical protein
VTTRLLPIATIALDLDAIHRIKDEGLQRSQVNP